MIATGMLYGQNVRGGSNYDYGNSIATDGNGNCYVTGYFKSATIMFGNITLTNNSSSGSDDMYVVKYDSSGNVLWAKRAGGGGYDYGKGIAIDGNGNCYVTGYFNSSTITFGSVMLTNTDNSGSSDMYLVKYDSGGNVLWAKRASGSSRDYGQGITADENGNCYVTGEFRSDTITFGSVVLTNAYSYGYSSQMYVVKYDSSGITVWAKCAVGSSPIIGSSIAVDGNGNCYATGFFGGAPLHLGV
ncbi:MAG: SBBP repeat-containing protein [Bacteroidota bacterium]